MRITALKYARTGQKGKNRGTRGDSLLILSPLGLLSRKPHFKCIDIKWWEYVTVKELGPFLVDIDCEGNNFFDRMDEKIEEQKRKALEELGIDESFAFTKLY